MICNICNNKSGNISFEPKEMMFGTGESFLYFQCSKCNCLQINEVPENLSDYYPRDYYSFKIVQEKKSLKNRLHLWRVNATIFNRGIISKIVHLFFPVEKYELINNLDLNKKSKIVDVGTGNGAFFLYELAELGFSNLLGIDPFLDETIEYKNGLRILKKDFRDLEGTWDLIIFHHSFEHMPDPKIIFEKIKTLLTPKGTCMLVIPTVSSFAWKHYGIHWAQLDAPRHLYLHSIESMNKLASSTGLFVKKVLYNSTDFQFAGSEKYLQGISLKEQIQNKYKEGLFKRKFRKWKYRQMAKKLNFRGEGDQAVFFVQIKQN